jgi:hypothetical protein
LIFGSVIFNFSEFFNINPLNISFDLSKNETIQTKQHHCCYSSSNGDEGEKKGGIAHLEAMP